MQKLNDANYDSVSSFVHAARNDLVNPSQRERRDNWLTRDRGDWYGADCHTGNDVIAKLRDGWPEGRAKCEAMLSKIDTSNLVPISRKRRLVKTDMGDHLDIQKVYMGELDTAWQVAKRQSTRGPQHISILANMVCSGAEDSEVLFWRGVAAIALADKLEEAGYNVRLVVGFGGPTGQSDEPTSCRITVKDYGMPLDVSTVSSVIMPGFFRAIGHMWIDGHCKKTGGANGGIMVKQCKVEEGETVLSHEIRNESSALATVQKIIEKINAQACGEIAA
jgi:hypothetical protein